MKEFCDTFPSNRFLYNRILKRHFKKPFGQMYCLELFGCPVIKQVLSLTLTLQEMIIIIYWYYSHWFPFESILVSKDPPNLRNQQVALLWSRGAAVVCRNHETDGTCESDYAVEACFRCAYRSKQLLILFAFVSLGNGHRTQTDGRTAR